MKCPRCGDRYELRSANQTHCIPCSIEVAALIEADTKRRAPRMPAKDLSGLTGYVL